MRDYINAEIMKRDAAAYIDKRIGEQRGVPDKAAAKIIAPLVEDGPTRELVILFMCGFAAAVVEGALLLAEAERGRG